MASNSQGVSMDEKSSPTTSGPDSDVASVEEDLPNDSNVPEEDTEGNQLFSNVLKENIIEVTYAIPFFLLYINLP